jgi:mRNA interferase HigB
LNVISKPGLLELARKHPETIPTLTHWYKVAKKAEWRGLHEVRREFPSADQVGDVLIFDILGRHYRLMTRVKYDAQRIYVKAFLSHREYDRKEWMKWA